MSALPAPPESRRILGVRVDATSYNPATETVLALAEADEGGYVCATSVHGVVEARRDPEFARVLDGACLVTPDGVPLVWALRALGVRDARRVYGPDLMPAVCAAAARAGIPIGLYGGTPEVLDRLIGRFLREFPRLAVVWAFAPPFRPLSPEEDAKVTEEILDSGARILFVGLGCPRQERWMAAHREHFPAVMLGVGAAFDFLARVKPQAPARLQRMGLEWAYRLACEPRRLGPRYLSIVPRFLFAFGGEWLRSRRPWARRRKGE
jgi:N-acetylglucosaminyldiphosphoundecaprenol N-acetyl-beta-D-mannosaminyltransferase